MTFAEALRTWIRDPVIAPLFVILALGVAILALTVFRAIGSGTFDITRLPRFLFDYVLAEFVPLAVLGFVVWTFGWAFPEPRTEIETLGLAALGTAYSAGCLAVIAKDVRKLLDLVNPPPELDIDSPVDG